MSSLCFGPMFTMRCSLHLKKASPPGMLFDQGHVMGNDVRLVFVGDTGTKQA